MSGFDTSAKPRSGRTHHGRALKTAILRELERSDYAIACVRAPAGFEGEAPPLLQACLESDGDETCDECLRWHHWK